MNETNNKYGYNKPKSYSLMVRDARGAIWNLGALFGIQGLKFQKQGQNLCHQGRNIEVRGTILGPPGVGFF